MAITVKVNDPGLQISTGVSGDSLLNKILALASANCTQESKAEGQSIPNSATAISLPISPCQVVWIKNTGNTNALQVTWTPQGGASNIVISLQPGSGILLIEAATGSGISALSLQAAAASTTVEYYLAG
jgi:hypothetical protein